MNKKIENKATIVEKLIKSQSPYNDLWEDVLKQKTETFEDHGKKTNIQVPLKKINTNIIIKK